MSEYPAWPSCSSRMGHLLTEFPANTQLINKISYNEKLSFWKNRLDASLHSNKSIFFNLDDLRENDKFNMKYKNELDHTNTVHIIKRQIFETVLAAYSSDYQDSYSFKRKNDAVIASYDNTWSFWAGDKLKGAIFGVSKVDFVSIKELSCISDLLTGIHGQTLDREMLNVYLNKNYRILSDPEINALLGFLKLNKLLIHDEDFQIFIIRKLDKSETNTQTKISESKLATFRLNKTLSNIQQKIDKENLRICGLKSEAKKFLANKNKTRALTVFKKAKIGEENLDRLYNQLDNIQGLLDGIENAQSDKEILESLKTGVMGLKSVQDGTSVDEVEDVMTELDGVLGDQLEIRDAIGRKSEVLSVSFDDSELEDELNDILKEEDKPEVKVRAKQEIVKLPEVPESAVNELELIMDEIEALKINKENSDETKLKSNNELPLNNVNNLDKQVLTPIVN